MTDADLVGLIESSRSVARARSLVADSRAGFESVLFDRLRHALGEDPGLARRLCAAGEGFSGDRAAWAHRFRGVKHRLDQKWLASANAFLRAESDGGDASMAVGAIDSLARAGRVARAVALAERLLTALDGEEAGRAALNAGNALLWADQVEKAIPFLKRALQDLTGLEQAAAWLGLSTAEIDYGSATSVREHADRALGYFESHALPHYAALAEQNLAQADLMAGRYESALQRLLRLRSTFDLSGEEHARNEQHLGETYLRLNMPVEAKQAFHDSLGSRGIAGLAFNKGQCFLGIAEAEMMLGNTDAAVHSAERARATFRRLKNDAGAAIAKSLVVQARLVSRGAVHHTDVLRLTEELERSSLRRRTAEMLFVLCEMAGDNDALERGRTIVHRHGLVDLEWRMHAASARTSPHGDRLAAYRDMAGAMWRSRSIHQSTVAKQHFLRDKDAALREYLGVLLNDPTQESVQEALDVVGEARSVALIDEILGASRGAFSSDAALKLGELREQIREEIGLDDLGGTRRGQRIDVASWRRAWHEAEGLLFAEPRRKTPQSSDLTYVLADDSYFRVEGSEAVRMGPREEFENRTRWLGFDLLEPMVFVDASATRVEASAATFARDLGYAPSRDGQTVLPDEALWHLPWPVIAGGRHEPVLSLAPGFRKLYSGGILPDSVLIWYLDSPALPHIRHEVETIVGLFPNARVCRTAGEARESLLGGQFDLMHIATHAALNPWNPMFSYLQFEDDRVFAAEIARATVRPRLVTMSACEAGSISTVESNEPDGLVRAALALGAESVVASAWPLDDRASSIFTDPYYSSLKVGAPVLDSVRAGRSAVRSKYAHPYYWGAMATFGGYQSP